MKRNSLSKIFYELTSVVVCVSVGVTILTFIFRGETISKTFISFVILLTGAFEIVNFLSLKDSAKIRNIPNMVTDLVAIALGLFLLFFDIQLETVVLIWAISYLVLYPVKIVTNTINFQYQPLYCSVKIVLAVILIVYMIILIVIGEVFIDASMGLVGYALLVESLVLLIEFMIHRYQ